MDILTYALLKKKVDNVTLAYDYKGSVATVGDLPLNAAKGDLYTVDGDQYVWDGTEWIMVNERVMDIIGDLSDLTTTAKTDLVSAINEAASSGSGLTEEVKQALLACFEKVAWTVENGQDYVDALESAFSSHGAVLSISAVYTQSGTVYDTDSLDSLKTDLVVTAHYDDSSTEVITTYVLSGTLAEGTSVITVTYGGKSATFSVTVTSYWDYTWDYTDGLLENDTDWTKEISGTAASSMTENGLALTSGTSSYVRYKRTNSDFNVSNGVLEFTLNTGNISAEQQNARICLSNGTNGIQIYAPLDVGQLKFVVSTGVNVSAGATFIANYTNNTDYTFRFELNGSTADIKLNGEYVLQNVDITTVYYSGNTCFMSQNATNKTWYLKSIKFKEL